MNTWQEWEQENKVRLNEKFQSPESQGLIRILKEDFTIKGPDLKESELLRLNDAVNRLLLNEPVQYITGKAFFYDIFLYVNPSVLIPRPETEELVELVLNTPQRGKPVRILDIGTGSGCIPIVIKRKWPEAHVVACDVSKEALKTAKKNAELHRVDIQFLPCNFLDEQDRRRILSQKWDIIISNPPYIPIHEKSKMGLNVIAYEPHLALFTTDNEGLTFYKAIADYAVNHLETNGSIYLEMNEFHAEKICEIFQSKGMLSVIHNDLSGKPRMLEVKDIGVS
jgi:release factor glutamine methyltransferase